MHYILDEPIIFFFFLYPYVLSFAMWGIVVNRTSNNTMKILQKGLRTLKPHLRKWRRNGRELRSTSLLSWAVWRMLQESWLVGSSIHAGLPPSSAVVPFPVAMTMEWCRSTRVWNCSSRGFSIYKYHIPLLQKMHLSVTFFIFLNPPPWTFLFFSHLFTFFLFPSSFILL